MTPEVAFSIAITGIFISLATLIINAHYKSRGQATHERYTDLTETSVNRQERKDQFDAWCKIEQSRLEKDISDKHDRIYARIEDHRKENSKAHEEMQAGMARIEGELRVIKQSVNGGLAARIKDAVKTALQEV